MVSYTCHAPIRFSACRYARWIQWGSYSAVFRSHDRGMSAGACADVNACNIVRVWNVPAKYFEVNRAALRNRAELLPYIYTAYRAAFDTGLSPLRPMYYDFPEEAQAYTAAVPDGSFAQYMFGDDLMVAPIVSAANTTTSMATKSVWLPPGTWVDVTSYSVYNSNSEVLTKDYDISEVPVFAKAGAVVPFRTLTA